MIEDTILAARSREYRDYVESRIAEYNGNGRKTILMVCDSYFPVVDGVIKVMDNVAKRLLDRCNVVALVPKYYGKVYEREYLVIGAASVFVKSLNYELDFPLFDFECKRYLRKLRIDLIHCHSPFLLGRLAVRMHRARGIPMVSSFHSQYKKDFLTATRSEALARLLLGIIMPVFKGSDVVWTMHDASRRIVREYGYRGEVALLPNATDCSYPDDAALLVQEANRAYRLKAADNVFIFVGRLVTQKNILFIADVLRRLKEKGVSFTMLFVGEGPDEGKLADAIAEYGLADSVVMTGKIVDRRALSAIYLRADLFLFPSLYDVSSIVQIEAAAHRTPVAFVEGSATSCTVTHDRNGFILPDDAEAYAEGVRSIVADRGRLDAVSENAYRDLYVSWDDVVAMSYERYLGLMDGAAVKK